MSLVLDENESFSLTANITSLGYQTIILKGYLMRQEAEGTYITPLLPQMFYDINGNQLGATWRQNFTATGDQTILSRAGGEPSVPRNELYWRKISNNHVQKEEVKTIETKTIETQALPNWLVPAAIIGFIFGGYIVYKLLK